jgi:hypothetical protein
VFCKYFLPIFGLYFHSLANTLCRAAIFTFSEITLANSFTYGSCLWYCTRRVKGKPKDIQIFLLCYPLGILPFCIVFGGPWSILNLWKVKKYASRFVFIFCSKHILCSCSSTIVEKTVFALLHCLCSFVKDQLFIFMWVYFWALFCAICLFFGHPTLSWSQKFYGKSWSQCHSLNIFPFIQYYVTFSFCNQFIHLFL